jgi:hypothetical protein
LIVTTSQTRTSDSASGFGHAELALDLLRESVPVGVVQSHLERLQPPEHGGADPAGCDGPDLHALEVV